MSILADWLIRDALMITPFHERTVHNGMTFGVSSAGYDVRIKQGRTLSPGEFFLASTVEHFRMRPDVVGIVHDKSTWARRGVTVQNTVIEPGWRGYLTLEIVNHSRELVTIHEGDPIAQIVFHKMEAPPKHSYSGKYQDQEDRPVPALREPA